MIDLHCHVLPAIDDGPATIDGSLALARAAVVAGVRTLVATPHVNARFPNSAATIARRATELRARLDAESIELELVVGAEVAMTRIAETSPAELAGLRIGASPWLLLEPPFTPVVTGLDSVVADLQRRGVRVLLAHPERCPAFHRDRRMLRSLVRGGVLTSVTAGSLTGQFGDTVRRFALELVREGLVHNVASDAHDDVRRPPGLAREMERAGFSPLTRWMTEQVPAAILDGAESIPAPPPVQHERGRRWLRRR